jgi:hypothetical protein
MKINMLAYNHRDAPFHRRQSKSNKGTIILFLFSCLCIVTILLYAREARVGQVVYGERATGVPVVNKAMMEKLRLLDLNREITEAELGVMGEADRIVGVVDYSRGETMTPSKPAQVDSIPETISPAILLDNAKTVLHRPNPLQPSVHLCPESPNGRCQFLVPAVIGEQETKAQLHLYQLGLLSLALGRRLVLPRVSKSRMGTCGTHPFSLYYDSLALSKLGIASITYEEFIAYSIQSQPPESPRLTAQIVSIASTSRSRPSGSIIVESTLDPTRPSINPRKNLCLRTGLSGMKYDDYSPYTILPPNGWYKSSESRMKFGRSIIATLDGKDNDVMRRTSRKAKDDDGKFNYELPDVIVMHYESRWAILEPEPSLRNSSPNSLTLSDAVLPFSYFDYAPPWISLANLIVQSMGPFVGIHWRTETVPAKNLYKCADGLISTLIDLKRRYPLIQTVYLATDYPIESITLPISPSSSSPIIAHSGTFTKSLTPVHAAAFRHLVDTLHRRTGLTLTGYLAEEQKIKIVPDYLESLFESFKSVGNDVSVNAIDSGLIAILDKLIVK